METVMEIINIEDDNILGGSSGERISVKVTERNNINGVAFSRDGKTGTIASGQTHKFTLTSDCSLVLTFTYANKNGDAQCTVEISGSNGGDRFTRTYFQSFGIPVDAKLFDFRVI
jgi:hypothetical protein